MNGLKKLTTGWWFGTSPGSKPVSPRWADACQFEQLLLSFAVAMGTEWDTAVFEHDMFNPPWMKLCKGDKVSVVVDGVAYTNELIVGQSLPDGKPVKIFGEIDPRIRGCRRLTILDAVFDLVPPYAELLLTDESMVLAHGLRPGSDLSRSVEFCAGLGATSVGLASAGFVPACSVEWRAPLVAVHETVHPSVPVVTGDIGAIPVLKQVAQIVEPPFMLVSGISCQPYSVGGSQGGSSDERSNTLPATLRACYLFQCPLLLLECVPPIRTNQYARSLLATLERELGYKVTELTLKLEDVWAARRFRWWFLASHPALGKISIPEWPKSASLVVRDLFPVLPVWPDDVLKELMLQPHECKQFTLDGSHMRKYVIQLDQKLSTCLHSWGSPADPCPCTCRSEGFSDALVLSRGIYAVVVPVPTSSGEPRYRHLHPAELAILNGLPPPATWISADHPGLRLCLCGVGQLASPLQALWIGSFIKQHVAMALGTSMDFASPQSGLQKFKQRLYDAAQDLFKVAPTCMPAVAHAEPADVVLRYPDSTQVTVKVGVDATVQQLQKADDALTGFSTAAWTDAATGLAVAEHENVHGLTLCVGDTTSDFGLSDALPDAVDLTQLERDLPIVAAPEPCAEPTVEPAAGSGDLVSGDSSVKRQRVDAVPSSPDALYGFSHLSGVQLAALVPPLVADVAHCARLRQMTVASVSRQQLLNNQGAAMGDDEVILHVFSCLKLSARVDVRFLDPLLASGWLRFGTVDHVRAWMALSDPVTSIVSVVLHEGHWLPIVWTCGLTEVKVSMWEHDEVAVDSLCPLHGLISQAWGKPMFALACNRRSFAKDHCGTAAVCFLAHVLLHKPLPESDEALQGIHSDLQLSFQAALASSSEVPRPWCWGLGVPDVLSLVSSLLQLHGVPSAQCGLRAKMVLQSLGKNEVQTAVTGVTPWKSLKQLANLHTPAIQLVLADEQARLVAARQSTAKPAKKSSGGTKRQPPARPAELDPAKLVIETGAFCVGEDAPLAQTPFATLGPLSAGVALATYQDAVPFLESGQVLSHGGLALLILNPPNDMQTALQWSTLRFAARCAYNQEPMLLSGALVQLGRQVVYQFQAKNLPAIVSTEVACARITVFADLWDQGWEDFANRPVKHVLASIPCLQTCRNQVCQCPAWHPPTSAQHDALLDVFRRQFFGENGRPTKWDKASYFAVLIRYVKALEPEVLSASGRQGVFVEPKTEDAMKPHDDYQVIWLPSLDFAAISHKAKVEAHCVGIARTGRRYGLRVHAKHFQEVFASVKPDAVYLAPGARLTYHTGPWPYGCDRKSIARALKASGWECRPLQPMQNVTGGLVWAVQAICEPPSNVLAMQHGQVVLTRHDPQQPPGDVPQQVVGQAATLRLCSVPETGDSDPWLTHDPWKKALANAPVVSTPMPTANVLQELEDRVERSILAKIPQAAETMEVDDQDQRLVQLEQQVQQLAGRQTQLEHVVTDNHTQQTAQVQSLQQQMLVQMDLQSKQMQNMLSDQMSRVETILSKKSRTE